MIHTPTSEVAVMYGLTGLRLVGGLLSKLLEDFPANRDPQGGLRRGRNVDHLSMLDAHVHPHKKLRHRPRVGDESGARPDPVILFQELGDAHGFSPSWW